MEGKAIIIITFKVRGKFICLMNFLRILNCCHNSRIMSLITIPFQLPSIKTYMLVPNLCNTIKKWLLALWFLKMWILQCLCSIRYWFGNTVNGKQRRCFILMIGIWADCRGCIKTITPNSWFF
jgi:hypothetical protein